MKLCDLRNFHLNLAQSLDKPPQGSGPSPATIKAKDDFFHHMDIVKQTNTLIDIVGEEFEITDTHDPNSCAIINDYCDRIENTKLFAIPFVDDLKSSMKKVHAHANRMLNGAYD